MESIDGVACAGGSGGLLVSQIYLIIAIINRTIE